MSDASYLEAGGRFTSQVHPTGHTDFAQTGEPTTSYILLALLVKFALLIAEEQRAPSFEAEMEYPTIVISRAHPTITIKSQVNKVVCICPRLHVLKFHRLARTFRQEESTKSES